MNIFRDKSPVQRGFFKNSAGDLLSAQRDVKKVKEKKKRIHNRFYPTDLL